MSTVIGASSPCVLFSSLAIAFRDAPSQLVATWLDVLGFAGNFSANSMPQVRLVNLAPSLASVSVALWFVGGAATLAVVGVTRGA